MLFVYHSIASLAVHLNELSLLVRSAVCMRCRVAVCAESTQSAAPDVQYVSAQSVSSSSTVRDAMSMQTAAHTAHASWEKAATEPCFPASLGHYCYYSGSRQNGVKQKCHGGQPWESGSGPSLSFHMECDTRGWRSWIRHGMSGPQGLALSIRHLHAWPKPRKRWKGEEKSIQSAYSAEFRSRFRRESRGFDQIVLSINWLYARRLVERFKVHCEDCWYLRNESLCMPGFFSSAFPGLSRKIF